VSIRLHSVRRPADAGEIGQEPVDRDDRHVVVPRTVHDRVPLRVLVADVKDTSVEA
jgi:hypothetical protein